MYTKNFLGANKLKISIGIAIIIHVGGFLAHKLWGVEFLASLSPYNLLFMSLLFIWNEIEKNRLWLYLPVVVLGFVAEWLGVHKGWVFGNYTYTHVLGFSLLQVPLIIGINWAMVVAGSFSISQYLVDTFKWKRNVPFIMVSATGIIATVFDFVMEPVAIYFNFWQWDGGIIPLYNYISWWAVSALAAAWFIKMNVRPNRFTIALVIAQFIFFVGILLIR